MSQSQPPDEIVDVLIAKPRLSWEAPAGDLGFELRQFPLRCHLVRALLRVPPGTTVALGLARGETVRVTARAVE